MTRSTLVFAAIIAAGTTLGACNNPKSAALDAATAQQAAADSAAKVQQKADARIASARADVHDEQRDITRVGAVEEQRLADAEADGNYKVALTSCLALSGVAQQTCRDQANADYDVARARAKQTRAATDPKR